MDIWIYLSQGFAVAMTPGNLTIALIGCFVGTIVGLLPGLGPINGVAILLPLAFALHLPAESALILLATVYIGCEYGGRISSILLNVPGDAAAIMTAIDGYPMAQQDAAAWRCRSRRELLCGFNDRYRRDHPVRAGAGAVVAGVRSGGIFRPDDFCHRLPRQHDGAKSAEIVSRRVNRVGAGDGGR